MTTTTKRKANSSKKTFKRNIRRIVVIATIAVIALTLTYLTYIAAKYCFHSMMCSWAERSGDALRYTATGLRNWTEFDIAWYNEEIALKQAFIESNAVATFYNVFSGNILFKIVRLAMWFAIAFSATLSWYLLYCIFDARRRSYQKRAMHKTMNESYTSNVIRFQAVKTRERKSYTSAGYYPERKAR